MQTLQLAREEAYRRIGELEGNLLSRKAPPVYELAAGGQHMGAWPASVLGALRIVRSEASVALITDGLSDPWGEMWGPELTAEPLLDYELALELSPSPREVSAVCSATWATSLLYRLADQLVLDRMDLAGRVAQFGAISYFIDAPTELESFGAGDGTVGILFAPFRTPEGGACVIEWEGRRISLISVRVLLYEEYLWAIANGNDTGMQLDQVFRGRHVHAVRSWDDPHPLTRPSMLSALALL